MVLIYVLSKVSMTCHGVDGFVSAGFVRPIHLCAVFYVFIHFPMAYG